MNYLNNKCGTQQEESLTAFCQSDGAIDANDAQLWATIGLPWHVTSYQIAKFAKRKIEKKKKDKRRGVLSQFQSIANFGPIEFNLIGFQLIGFGRIEIALQD